MKLHLALSAFCSLFCSLITFHARQRLLQVIKDVRTIPVNADRNQTGFMLNFRRIGIGKLRKIILKTFWLSHLNSFSIFDPLGFGGLGKLGRDFD